MKVHKSRLEREREETAARLAENSAAGQEKPLPSYMRATKASIAMKKVSNNLSFRVFDSAIFATAKADLADTQCLYI